MRALTYFGPKDMRIVDVPEPIPAPNEVKIAMRQVGICGSDVHGFLGTTGRRIPPMVMGHEFSGEVAAVGSAVTCFKAGDRVTALPTISCGECEMCRQGLDNICENRLFLGTMSTDGTLCDYLCIDEKQVYALPDGMSYEYGALIEPFAVAYRSVRKALPLTGKTVLITGAGVIGLLVLKLCVYYGAKNLIVADLSPDRLAVARKNGATLTIDPAHEDADAVLTEAGLRRIIDVTIEAVGVTPTAQMTVDYCRNHGDVIWIGNSAQMVTINMQQVVTRELTIHGNYIYNTQDFIEAMNMLGSGEVDVHSFISDTVSLEDATAMFERLAGGDATMIKVLVDMQK